MRDWDMLRYVLAISREGGLSGAARALDVTHATVSRQLARAEAELGVALFTRLATGLEPTEAWREVAARAGAIEAEMLALDLSLAATEQTERLRVTIPPLMVDEFFASDIKVFRQECPQVRLEIRGDNRLLNLHRREADVAIRISHDPAESLWGRIVARQRNGWFAAPGFRAEHAAVLERGEAGALPYIGFSGWPQPVPKDLLMRFPGAEPVLECDDLMVGLSFMRAGIGMSRAPWLIGNGDPGLEHVPQLPLREYAPIWLLTHPELRRNALVRRFMSFMADRYAGRAEAYLGPEADEFPI